MLRERVNVSIFSQEMLWSRLCIHWSGYISPNRRINFLGIWLYGSGCYGNDESKWQYKKGFKQYTPFINLCECIMCLFKIHCTKHRCELHPDAFWVEFLSRSHWRDLTRLQQLFTTLTMGERDTESRVHFLEWKKEWKKIVQLKDNKKMLSFPEFPVNLGWKRWVF